MDDDDDECYWGENRCQVGWQLVPLPECAEKEGMGEGWMGCPFWVELELLGALVLGSLSWMNRYLPTKLFVDLVQEESVVLPPLL